MLDPDEKDTAGKAFAARCVFVVGPDRRLKLSILYPSSTGRNFTEVSMPCMLCMMCTLWMLCMMCTVGMLCRLCYWLCGWVAALHPLPARNRAQCVCRPASVPGCFPNPPILSPASRCSWCTW